MATVVENLIKKTEVLRNGILKEKEKLSITPEFMTMKRELIIKAIEDMEKEWDGITVEIRKELAQNRLFND